MARRREEDNYTPLEWAQKQVGIWSDGLARAKEKLRVEECRHQWAQGYFTYYSEDSIPAHFFPLTLKILAKWKRECYGPQSPKEDWIEISKMHHFLWCKDIKEFPQGKRRFMNEIRRRRLDTQLLEIENLIRGLRRVIDGQTPDSNWRDPGAWKRHFIEYEPLDGFENLKETLPMFKTTADVRGAMIKLFKDVEDGVVTASVARTKVQVAKTIVDTLKVEIAAANLGKQFGTLRFDDIESQPATRRIAAA